MCAPKAVIHHRRHWVMTGSWEVDEPNDWFREQGPAAVGQLQTVAPSESLPGSGRSRLEVGCANNDVVNQSWRCPCPQTTMQRP